MKELALSTSAMFDEEKAPQLGKPTGASLVLLGEVTGMMPGKNPHSQMLLRWGSRGGRA